MIKTIIGILVLSLSSSCSTSRSTLDPIAHRLSSLKSRFPRTAADYYESYKQAHANPLGIADLFWRYDAGGEVVLRKGDRIAVRFDSGCPRPAFEGSHVELSVYLDKRYKGEFLVLEVWEGHAFGWLVSEVRGEVVRRGDRVTHIPE